MEPGDARLDQLWRAWEREANALVAAERYAKWDFDGRVQARVTALRRCASMLRDALLDPPSTEGQ